MNMGKRPPLPEDSLLQEPTGFIPAVIAEMRQEFDVRLEDGVYNAVCEVGFKVDKEELMKLLRGDRQSYEKGYEDGKRDAVKHGQWDFVRREVRTEGGIMNYPVTFCSQCGLSGRCLPHYNYCPNCGAKMSEGVLRHE